MANSDKEKKSEKNLVEKNLEKQFQQMGEYVEAPKDLKDGVFDTLDSLALIGDVMDLFTGKFAASEVMLMNLINTNEEDSFSDNNSNLDQTGSDFPIQ